MKWKSWNWGKSQILKTKWEAKKDLYVGMAIPVLAGTNSYASSREWLHNWNLIRWQSLRDSITMFCTIRKITYRMLLRSNTSQITFSSSLTHLRYNDFRANYEGVLYAFDVEIEFEATETIYVT